VANPHVRARRAGAIRVALIGAGDFAKGMHLPNMQALPGDFQLQAVASRSGHNAAATATQFGAKYATTDYLHVLEDPEVDLVLVATRHDLHAQIALAALRCGKHVLVEKPLALTRAELDEILAFYDGQRTDRADPPLLLTGFNRRFSPYAGRIAEVTHLRTNPMILNYRMNAGYLPLDHWVHGDEGGGRNRGEACHIYDLFTFLTGSRVSEVHARAIRPTTGHYGAGDNFVATIGFEDGSVASLTYTALGAAEYPKEHLDVFVDGRVISLQDYRRLAIVGAPGRGLSTAVAEKGQKEELVALARAIRAGGEWPIPLWQQAQATEIALEIEPYLTGQT
jgi:predicted dehydrogenase